MKTAIVATVAILGVYLGWYLVSPLFINNTVEEAFPTASQVAAMSPQERESAMKEVFARSVAMPDKPMQEPMAGEGPKAIKRGAFRDVDSVHKGSGNAVVYALDDRTHLVRLEDVRIANGPDLYVYLTEHADPGNASDVEAGFVNLGKLKGNIGSQNYPVPADTDISKYGSVVIWCRLFGVLFSPAALSPL